MANYCDKEKMKRLVGDDRIRMARLFEEISANIQEMSTIMSRLHGQPAAWTKAIITQPNSTSADGSDDADIEVEHIVNPETGDSGCYDHVEMTCGPC